MWRTNENRPFKAIIFAFAAISPLLIASFVDVSNLIADEPFCLHCGGDGWSRGGINYEKERARVAYPHRVVEGSNDDQLFLHIFAMENQEMLQSQSNDDIAVKRTIAMGLAKGMPKRPNP